MKKLLLIFICFSSLTLKPSSSEKTVVIVYNCQCTNCTCTPGTQINKAGDRKVIEAARSMNFTPAGSIFNEKIIKLTLPSLNSMVGFSFTPTKGEALTRKKAIKVLLYHDKEGRIMFYRQFEGEGDTMWTELGEITDTEDNLNSLSPIMIRIKADGSAVIPNPRSSEPMILFLSKLF